MTEYFIHAVIAGNSRIKIVALKKAMNTPTRVYINGKPFDFPTRKDGKAFFNQSIRDAKLGA